MTVRLATANDATELARLRYEFRAAINPPGEDADAFVARAGPWMRDRLTGAGSWRCWVIESEGTIAGHLWLQLIEKVPNPGAETEIHAYITNVYVRPAARGRGFGEALMTAAVAFCRDQRVDSAILWPTERSRSLYRRFGFDVRDDIMELVVTEGRDLH